MTGFFQQAAGGVSVPSYIGNTSGAIAKANATVPPAATTKTPTTNVLANAPLLSPARMSSMYAAANAAKARVGMGGGY